MHVLHVGVKPHGFARSGGAARLDATADFPAIDSEKHHGFHSHRLDHVEGRGKFAILIAVAAARLSDVLRPKAERQLLPGELLVARGSRRRYRQADLVGNAHAKSGAVLLEVAAE